jgi:hypothetical protein
MSTTSHVIAPAIKPGIRIRRIGSEFLSVESPDQNRSLVLPSFYSGIDIAPLLKLMDGTREIAELAKYADVDVVELKVLIEKLANHSILDTHRTPIPYLDRYNSVTQKIESVDDVERVPDDPAVSSFLHRFSIESAAMAFHPGASDGGRLAVLARKNFSVHIVGNNRLAHALLTTLIASGFSRISLSHHSARQRKIQSEISASDLSASLFPIEEREAETNTSSFDLVIATEQPAPEDHQRWISEGQRHLFITTEDGGTIRIGPLVQPGKSPCLRCMELSDDRPDPIRDLPMIEIPHSLVSLVSGIVAADISNLAYSALSVFWATTIRYSLREFIAPQFQKLEPHPGCGCFWR